MCPPLPPVARLAWVLSIVGASLTATAPLASQTAPTVDHLRAFARLYGYVRYFHPGDAAAAVPWDAFVVDGVRQVRAARTRAQLQDVLETLFRPVAPSVQVFPTAGPVPAPLVHTRPDTADHPTVAWQHLGLGLAVQGPYRSIRVNRANPVPGGSAFGTVIGSVDATPYAGATVRLRGFVRADVAGSGNQGQLWLRVDRAGGQRGFFDNMQERPITAADWQPYEIVGEVAGDASHIVFGCFLYGRGTVWVDDIELSVRTAAGDWTPIPVLNAGFEDMDDAGKPRGWFAATPGYAFTVVEEGVHGGRRALAIRDAASSTAPPLFAAVPQVGAAVVKELGAGLSARIPLALYGDDAAAHGSPSAPAFVTLRERLERVGVDTLTADHESVRLADVIIAWNVFQHFYPYRDVVPGNWDVELTTALESALADRTAGDFLHTLDRLVAALHDGHARVVARRPPTGNISVRFEWIENQVVVTWAADTALRPGDLVLAVDGAAAGELVRTREREISGSPQWKRYRSMSELGIGDDGTGITLRVQRGSRVFDVVLARSREAARPARGDSVRLLGDDIWYVDLDRAEMPAINAHINALAHARGVIFDLRGYPKGNHWVLSHLLTAPDTSGAWMRIPRIVYPDQERPAGTTSTGWRLQPAEPHISGKVVFITDGRAISYAESFMSFVEHYRLGEIVGQATAGTNGNVNVLVLPGGYRVPWTGMRVVKHDGSQHHLVGIQPTIPVTRTITGVREGRDELLERALAVIRGEPPP